MRLVGLRIDKIEKALDSGHGTSPNGKLSNYAGKSPSCHKDSVVIKEAATALHRLQEENFWITLSHQKLEFLRAEIKPLFRTVSEADFKAMRFERDLLEYSWRAKRRQGTSRNLQGRHRRANQRIALSCQLRKSRRKL